jgi:hypothetical protein
MIAEHVSTLTKEQVLRLWDRNIAKNGPHRQKLSVQVFSSQHKDAKEKPTGEDVVVIDDTVEFKRSSKLFPLPKSVDVSNMTMEAILAASGKGDTE